MLHQGAKVGIVCCSNGLRREDSGKIGRLEEVLRQMGLQPVFSDYIYAVKDVFSGTARERASALMEFYREDEIEAVFDISGGEIANGILPYLDYDLMAASHKMFWGYSDLTTVLNAVYAKTGKVSVLYQIRNLIGKHGAWQCKNFGNTVMKDQDDLFCIDCRMLPLRKKSDLHNGFGDSLCSMGQDAQGSRERMQGIVVGGNIRCFLKLAGTEYMPDLQDKILFLESFHGTAAQIETYLCQLAQIGAFREAAGILLGTFTQMQEEGSEIPVEMLVREAAGEDMPIAVTKQIGHGSDSKGICIGRNLIVEAGVLRSDDAVLMHR